MKKLLFQLDTDPIPNLFDTVVAYDGGADHVAARGGITPENVGKLVDGAIFTRAPSAKKYTALFVTGSNMAAGEAVFRAIRKHYFGNFRVSVMLDSNGSNTTAAASTAYILRHVEVRGKRVVVLAGTGPVGQRAGMMLAQAGAEVILTSRRLDRSRAACAAMKENFDVDLAPAEAATPAAVDEVLSGAHVVIAAGTGGVELLAEAQWRHHPTLELLVDANPTPPLGIGGVEAMDQGAIRHGKVCFGALGFGGFKLEVHRTCIEKMFESNKQCFDGPEIFALARELLADGQE